MRIFLIDLSVSNSLIMSDAFIFYVIVSDRGWGIITKNVTTRLIYNMPDHKICPRKIILF